MGWEDLIQDASEVRRHNERCVFISHAAEDIEIAFNVAATLKRFLDLDSQVDRGFLRSGQNWRAEIKRRIRRSELLLVLLSRVVAGELAEGVMEEIKVAQSLNIPVIFGTIRGYHPELAQHYIDFGEDGRRTEGVWELAKFLISESHQFRVLGVDSFHVGSAGISSLLGSPEQITARAGAVSVLGHTMKQWLGDYGNAIRHSSASVKMYFPARRAIGVDLLSSSHRSGDRILDQIERAKREALGIEKELGNPSQYSCFVVPVKPMFSATVIDPGAHDACIVVDHYSFRVGAEDRPKIVVRGADTPMFGYYWKVFQHVIADAVPLNSEF